MKTERKKPTPTMRLAWDAAESIHPNIDFSETLKHVKRKDISRQRFLIWALMRQAGMSLHQIGRAYGGYCHTSILYGIRQAKDDYTEARIKRIALAAGLSNIRKKAEEAVKPKRKPGRKAKTDTIVKKIVSLPSNNLKAPTNLVGAVHALSQWAHGEREWRGGE